MRDYTIHLVEMKRKSYNQWQDHRTDVERQREYRSLRLAVRKAVRKDREAWLNVVMKGMKDSINRTDKEISLKIEGPQCQQCQATSTIFNESGRTSNPHQQTRLSH